MATRAKWKGLTDPDAIGYEHHGGIPARDLDDDEYRALTADQRETVRKSPLYDYRTEDEVAKSPARTGGESRRRRGGKGAATAVQPVPSEEPADTPAEDNAPAAEPDQPEGAEL